MSSMVMQLEVLAIVQSAKIHNQPWQTTINQVSLRRVLNLVLRANIYVSWSVPFADDHNTDQSNEG
jgi:hypothetical protein